MQAPEAKRGGIYKRMETDAEYTARLDAARRPPMLGIAGHALDEHGDSFGIRRRIVESTF